MRVFFLFLAVLTLKFELAGQSNKWQVDAGVAFGMAYPQGEHKYQTASVRPTQFALPGWNFRLDCHSGIANGWKVGLLYSRYHAPISSQDLANYLLQTIDTSGYFITTDVKDNAYYESGSWSVQLANDIPIGKLLITPQFALGIASLVSRFSAKYDLKQMGTNYYREVVIETDTRTGIGFLITAGVKAGYSFNISEHRFCLFLMGEYYGYHCTTALKYMTTDVLDNVITNYQWFSGDIKYGSLSFGATYFVK